MNKSLYAYTNEVVPRVALAKWGYKIMFSLPPQFFDIFGFVGFIYITAFSLLALRGKSLPKWMFIILFLIGIIGLLVDGSIVYTSYLR